MTKSLNHHTVVLKLPDAVPALLLRGRHIVLAMTESAWFSGLLALIAVVSTDLDDLQASEVTVLTRVEGAAAARDVIKKKVVDGLTGLAFQVQTIVDQAQPGQAPAITEAAGMFQKKSSARPKANLAATMGQIPGQVLVYAKAVKGAAYEWQISTDDGATWVALALTTCASTSATGLARGTSCLFRFRTTRRNVTDGWSESASICVH
jgi:hypothetical protein